MSNADSPGLQKLCKTYSQAAAAAKQPKSTVKAKQATDQAVADATQAAGGAITMNQIEEKLNAACQQGLTPQTRQEAVVTGLNRDLDTAFEDHLLSEEEEEAMRAYIDKFIPYGLAKVQATERLDQVQILRVVCEGNVPDNIIVEGYIPFNPKKSEKLIYIFDGVQYCERMTRTRRWGTSHGVSIWLAKGLYYSPRQSQSQTEEWQETFHRDTGMLGMTTKHIYFGGPEKAFRRPYSKIASTDYEYDGISYVPDLANAKPQVFRIGDT